MRRSRAMRTGVRLVDESEAAHAERCQDSEGRKRASSGGARCPADGWYAVALRDTLAGDRAELLADDLKKLGKIPADSLTTYGNTCARSAAADFGAAVTPILTLGNHPRGDLFGFFSFVGFLPVEIAMRLIDRIRSRAYELAREGRHADCEAVEEALEREGHADARMALRDPYVRARVSALCSRHHRRVRPEASAYLAPSALPGT